MKLLLPNFLKKSLLSGLTFGRSASLCAAFSALCLLRPGSASADTITQADADRIGAAVVDALIQNGVFPETEVVSGVTYPVDDNTENIATYLTWAGASVANYLDSIFAGLFTSANPENFHYLLTTWREAWQNASETQHLDLGDIRSLLTIIQQDTDNLHEIDLDEIERALVTIRAAVSGGFVDQNGNPVAHGIQSMLEDQAEYHAGYRTATDAGSWALSVRDDDAISAIEQLNLSLSDFISPGGYATEISNLIQNMEFRLDDSKLRATLTGVLGPRGEIAQESQSDVSDQQFAAQSASYQLKQGIDMDESTANAGYDNARSEMYGQFELGDYVSDGSMLPFMDSSDIPSIPGGDENSGPSPQLDGEFYAFRDNIRVFKGIDVPLSSTGSSLSLSSVDWNPRQFDNGGEDSATRWFDKCADFMSVVWALAFAVWVFNVAKTEWKYYMVGGGSDASMLAEEVTARAAMDQQAALFGDAGML